MSSAFLERARLEAERYGSDPWVFVRELLQNGRDAGATEVRFEVFEATVEGGAESTVICRDDGEGMSFDHARRFLFALYASSKEGKRNQAGKFGVGFWSILRFEPTTIVVRSCPRKGAPWGLALDGRLERAVAVEPPSVPGTEIVLRRPGADGRLEHRVSDAVWQSARFLARRDDPRVPVRILVNGRSIQAEFALPAPSSSFRRGEVRGVVGLGPAPRVELFSRGLRVRSAASLSDLLSAAGRHSDWMRVRFPELPDGLAPQALLESPDLAVMLSRADARDDRALQKLVRRGQRELERLIERHVAAIRPLPWWTRLRHWLGDRLRALTPARVALGGALGGLVALAAVLMFVLAGRVLPGPAARSIVPPLAPGAAEARSSAYDDPGRRYQGPSVEVFGPEDTEPLALSYRPARRRPRFAMLTLEQLAADGSPVAQPVAAAAGAYRAAPCGSGCLEVQLALQTREPTVRLPLPTGHRLAGGVMLGGRPARLAASADGRPLLVLDRPAAGQLRYRTAPAAEPSAGEPAGRSFTLPPELGRHVQQLRALPAGQRVAALRELVRQRVRYDHSEATVRRHREAIARGDGFIARTLAAGAGDCDVQNGLLTALLQAAGLRARLAVGYLGERGTVLPWVHAWVEYLGAGDRWTSVDASAGASSHPELLSAFQPAPAGAPPPVRAPELITAEPAPVTAPPPTPAAPPPTPAAPPPTPAAEPAPAVVAAPPVRAEAPAAERDPGGTAPPTRPAALPPWLRHAPLLLFPLGAWLLLRGRTRRTFKLDTRGDAGAQLAQLLRGVLQQPGAFSHLRALHHRPLVPLADGRVISLTLARDLVGRGRLFATRTRPPLAARALRAGAAVLDLTAADGRVVADALGAIDLDGWASILAGAQVDPLLAAVNRTLRAQGETWVVHAAADVPGGVAAIDLKAIGARLPGVGAGRLVAVQASAPWLAQARGEFSKRPQAAVFLVLDHLAARLDLGARRRRRVLGESARAALLESFAP